MRRFQILIALFLSLSAVTMAPAEAAWAVALAKGQLPVMARQYQFPSQAKTNAMNICERDYGAGTCEIVGSGVGGCLGLARTGKYWGFGKASGRKAAEDAALKACTALHLGACKVVHSSCGE